MIKYLNRMHSIKLLGVMVLCMLLLSSCAEKPNKTCVPAQEALKVVNNIPDIFKLPDPYVASNTVVNQANGLTITGNLMGPITWLNHVLSLSLSTGSENIYKTIVSPLFLGNVIKAALVLVIVVYGFQVLLNMVNFNAFYALLTGIKIIVVFNLALNWDLFNSFVVNNLEEMVKGITNSVSNAFIASQKGAISGDADAVQMNMLERTLYTIVFSPNILKLLAALITSFGAGLLLAFLFVHMMFSYLSMVIYAMKTFFLALIGRWLLYSVAPIFIMFKLFKKTESLFDAWIQQLMNFSFQPVFLFTVLGLMHAIILDMLGGSIISDKTALLCDRCIVSAGPFGCWGNGWGLKSPTGKPFVGGITKDIPINIWYVIALILLIKVLQKMSAWSVEVAARISGGMVSAAQMNFVGWERLTNAAKHQTRGAKGLLIGSRDGKGHWHNGLLAAPFASAARKVTGRKKAAYNTGGAWSEATVAAQAAKNASRRQSGANGNLIKEMKEGRQIFGRIDEHADNASGSGELNELWNSRARAREKKQLRKDRQAMFERFTKIRKAQSTKRP